MINFTWKFLELYSEKSQLASVRYLLTGTDGTNIIESEGKHDFKDNTVNKAFDQIVETDLIQWIEKDTTIDDVNAIKSALESQLKSLNKQEKVDFPWLAGTFTVE